MSRKNDRHRGKRGLSQEDAALWARFSKSVKPLDADGRIIADSQAAQAENDSRETPSGGEAEGRRKPGPGSGRMSRARPQVGSAPPAAKPERVPASFDERQARRLASGRTQVDARIDLHGMRQAEARQALRRFLFNAMAKGHRTVLVITGKGAPAALDRPWNGGEDDTRGVLRRMVPIWLGEPELAVAVVSFRQAHVRHGGEGALYVHVRRQGRA